MNYCNKGIILILKQKKLTVLLSSLNKQDERKIPTINNLIDTTEKNPRTTNNSITTDGKEKAIGNIPKTTQQVSPSAALSRAEVKNKICDFNKKAQQADKEMRIALSEKRLLKANTLLQERNQFNSEVKKLLQQLQTPKNKTTDQATQNIKPVKKKNNQS